MKAGENVMERDVKGVQEKLGGITSYKIPPLSTPALQINLYLCIILYISVVSLCCLNLLHILI